MKLEDVFNLMIKENASDAFLRPGQPPKLRVLTEVCDSDGDEITEKNIADAVSGVLGERELEALETRRGCDTAVTFGESWRFRLGIFYQQDKLALVARKIDLKSLSFGELNLPGDTLMKLCRERRGLILLAGMTGSGKSTTIASMIEYINSNFGRHILTVEEPVEYIFKDKMSSIDQREVGRDVMDYESAIKQSATLSPDVFYVGDIRDATICNAVLKAAEKGMLVISTVHSINTRMAIETLASLFPLEQQDRIYYRLSLLLKGVVSQRLIPRSDTPGLIPAYEVMAWSPTIANAISEKRLGDIAKILREGTDMFGTNTYNQCLIRLMKEKKITKENALDYSDNKRDIEVMLSYGGS
ncbi:MAG TPA: ATPase, T2SS/T4P/T4SS family [bacterium]|nr:ATPase, T2SS/T4P/T4SS family [bacterium]